MPAPDIFYGIDIGGTKMELVACDAALQVRYRQRVPTPTHDFDVFVNALCGMVRQADEELGERAALGLGVPGIIDAATGAHLSANVPCLTGRQLLPVLRRRLERDVTLGNDCQCFALSEAHGGAAHAAASMFGLIIGTGAGAGFVADGRLVRGRNGVAGEWGHWPIAPSLLKQYQLPILPCACGRQACLECYVSGSGLRKLHAHLSGTAGMSAEELATLRDSGDTLASAVFAVHLDLLGAALAQIVLAYDPHVVVLGGGLSQLPHLYRALPAAAAAHLIPGMSVPPILPPWFGDAGGARGAALLAAQAAQPITEEA
ncbi:ROK family protein [Pseudoduganella sp. OTU4001]|uniref:ROK family protein n=1 Tax=Pseudoduganella sp. OTU4001 TaxID=3043854 RepID=UPI00313DCE3F